MVTDATNTDQELLSDLPIPPGETVLEGIEYHGLSMRELAEKIGCRPWRSMNSSKARYL